MVERYVAEAREPSPAFCPRPLTPPPSLPPKPPPPPPGPGRKFTATRTTLLNSARPAPRLPPTTIAAIAHNFQNSAHKTFRETTELARSTTRSLSPLPNFVIGFSTPSPRYFARILFLCSRAATKTRSYFTRRYFPTETDGLMGMLSRKLLKIESFFPMFSKKEKEKEGKRIIRYYLGGGRGGANWTGEELATR